MTKLVARISHNFDKVAGWVLVAIMALVIANILTRRILNYPIGITYEGVSFLILIVNGFALANCSYDGGYIASGLLLQRLKPRVQKIITTIIYILDVVILGLASWGVFKLAGVTRVSGEVTDFSRLPFYPFIYLLAIGLFLLTLAVLTQFRDIDSSNKEGH